MSKNKDHDENIGRDDKPVGTKNTVLFSFNGAALKELRKVLFKRGLSAQEFFSYIIDRICIRDPRMEALLSEISNIKQEKLKSGDLEKKHRDANSLYEAIEKENKQNKEEP